MGLKWYQSIAFDLPISIVYVNKKNREYAEFGQSEQATEFLVDWVRICLLRG
jgi:hypothetical protein